MELNKKLSLKIVLVIFAVIFILYVPKIMLRNKIYYESIHINLLNQEYTSLKEENRFLLQQLEDIKFKNQITDSLIMKQFETDTQMQPIQAETNDTKEH